MSLNQRLQWVMSDGESTVTFTPNGEGYGCKVNDLQGYGNSPLRAMNDALRQETGGPGSSKRAQVDRHGRFKGTR